MSMKRRHHRLLEVFNGQRKNGSKRITGVFISKKDICYVKKEMHVLVLNSLKCIFPLIFNMIQIWFWKINLRVYSQAKTWIHIWHIFTLKNKQCYRRLIGTSSVIKTEWSNIMYTRHHILLLITNRSLLLTKNKGRIFLLQKVG